MASRLVARAANPFGPVHVHRAKRASQQSTTINGVIIAACGAVLAIACFFIFRVNGEVASELAASGAAEAGPLRKTEQTHPRRTMERRSSNRDAWNTASARAIADNESDGFSQPVPWASSESSNAWRSPNPFESEQPIDSHGTIDELVFKRLADLDIKPAKLCSDEVFLRRIYVDVLGTLPTVQEARAFLDDPDPEKRAKLIDQALERPEFADYWAMKWSDLLRVKAEFPIKLWPNAAQAYHRWIHTAIKNNLPYDDFARELLTSSGSNFRAPQVNFYRAVQNKEPKGLAQAAALTFLGERAERWPTERLDRMSVFFSQVGYKPTGEWKEEIVFFDRRKGKDPEAMNEPLRAIYHNGIPVEIPPGQDPREVFADWLVEEKNPWFARVIANRVWCWLVGRGIVDPPDDVRADNRPSNPALLNHLAAELVAADFDLRQLYRLILNSRTYQLACIPGSEDAKGAENFAYYPVRRQDAEVLIDAICQITGTSESYMSIIPEPFTFLPEGTRAVALPDGSITSSFLEMFGRPPRDTGLESERNNRLTAAQALHLLNSNHLRNKLKQGPGIEDLTSGELDPVEAIYLAILSRRPTDEEHSVISGMGSLDGAWALINSDEFLFRH